MISRTSLMIGWSLFLNFITHSLKYFVTASSQVPNFPEFEAVGMVDDVQIVHYDGNTRTAVPKQDWMKKVIDDDPEYFKRSTNIFMSEQQDFKDNIEKNVLRSLCLSDVHIYQVMYGCEWDDEMNEVNGYRQYGYDGEDFISLDLKTETWIAPNQQAFITKQKWENNKARTAYLKNYHTQICPECECLVLVPGSSGFPVAAVVGGVVGLLVLIAGITAAVIYGRKYKGEEQCMFFLSSFSPC
uniref:MHC class I-like antigen recognition-like domain-containing protein n=1 Tax=Acanthochromis polyacanthus TaxID=80966 RepID=A0A3Q1GX39_9TELE